MGRGHPASNRSSSGSSLLAERNRSEGGWVLYFRAGREVKAIREDGPPGKEGRGEKGAVIYLDLFPEANPDRLRVALFSPLID